MFWNERRHFIRLQFSLNLFVNSIMLITIEISKYIQHSWVFLSARLTPFSNKNNFTIIYILINCEFPKSGLPIVSSIFCLSSLLREAHKQMYKRENEFHRTIQNKTDYTMLFNTNRCIIGRMKSIGLCKINGLVCFSNRLTIRKFWLLRVNMRIFLYS